jgi:sugar/nucleoside kinase (ribokinase family)
VAHQDFDGFSSCTFDVLLHGDPFCDLTFSFADRERLPPVGHEVFADSFAINPGGTFNISAALTRLGLRVGLKACLGTDIFSRYIGERMEACGLSSELISWTDIPKPVVTVGISFPHDRLFISYDTPGTGPRDSSAITVDELDRYQPRVLFSYGGEEHATLREARRRGILVVLDTHWDADYLRSDYLRATLAEVDVAAPNLPEALEITGAANAESALDRLADWCPCAVIKMGPDGCLAACNGTRYHVPAMEITAVETTGAGDNFNAGLIYGMLRGYPFETALRCANVTGGLSTLISGGCEANISADVVESMIALSSPEPKEADHA